MQEPQRLLLTQLVQIKSTSQFSVASPVQDNVGSKHNYNQLLCIDRARP